MAIVPDCVGDALATCIGDVCPLTTIAVPDGAKEYVVPAAVIADPGASVWDPMTYCDALFAVILLLAMVIIPDCVGSPCVLWIVEVCPFTTTAVPNGAREYVVPPVVSAEPGASV